MTALTPEAILPISDEEIDSSRARRHIEFGTLVHQAADILSAGRVASADRLNWSNGEWGVGRYLRAPGGAVFWFGLHTSYWAHDYPTPWWLQFGAKRPAEVHEALKALKADPRFPYVMGPPDRRKTAIAIPAPLGAEADEAARSIADYVTLVCQALPQLAEPSPSTEDEPESADDPLQP